MTWQAGDPDRRRISTPLDLHVLETEVRHLRTDMERRHVENTEKLDKVVLFIDGNGSPGAKVRIDRLEQQQKWTNAMWALVSGLSAKTLWDLVTKR